MSDLLHVRRLATARLVIVTETLARFADEPARLRDAARLEVLAQDIRTAALVLASPRTAPRLGLVAAVLEAAARGGKAHAAEELRLLALDVAQVAAVAGGAR